MLDELARHILDGWETHFPGSVRPSSLSYLNATGAIEGGTTTFLAFADRSQLPLFVVKVGRRVSDGVRLGRESELLNRLATCPDVVAGAVPRSICHGHSCTTGLLVLSVIPGSPMALRRKPEGVPDLKRAADDLGVATTWLAEMHLATRRLDVEARDVARRRLLEVVSEFRESFVLTAVEDEVVVNVVDALEDLLDRGVVVQHGDFSSQNILMETRSSGRPSLGVIDWTWSEEHGLPAHDLLFLLIGYSLQLRVGSGLPGFVGAFRQCLIDEGSARDMTFDLFRRYCRAIGFESAHLPQLILWFLIERTVFDYRMLSACSAHGIWPRWTLALAAESLVPLSEVSDRQYWISLFRTYVSAIRTEAA